MRILFITGSLNQGGAEYQILLLAKLFRDNGHEIEVFAITDYDFYKQFIDDENIPYTHLYNQQNKIKRVWLTAKKIKSYQPELIISYLKITSQVALVANKLSGVNAKLIVGERTSDIQRYYDQYHFNLMRLADHITVNSISKLEYLKNNFPALKNKTSFLTNIIEINKFKFKEPVLGGKTLGYVGRIAPEKNILELLQAIKILKDSKLDITLKLYGEAKNIEYKKLVDKTILKLDLTNDVFYEGPKKDITQIYSQIDCLCLISDYEGFSNVISEALCSGLPVITSNIPENKYLIENVINGFVINHKDPLSIASGISTYWHLSYNTKKIMALQNRKKAEYIFNKEILYNKYMNIIENIMNPNY